MGADLATIEARLETVEKIQTVNVPKFTSALRRLAKLEKAVATTVETIAELRRDSNAQIERSKANSDLLTANSEKIEAIYAFMTHTRSAWGWVRHHSPKLATFLIGVAIARGWISAENGHNFLHVFGL